MHRMTTIHGQVYFGAVREGKNGRPNKSIPRELHNGDDVSGRFRRRFQPAPRVRDDGHASLVSTWQCRVNRGSR